MYHYHYHLSLSLSSLSLSWSISLSLPLPLPLPLSYQYRYYFQHHYYHYFNQHFLHHHHYYIITIIIFIVIVITIIINIIIIIYIIIIVIIIIIAIFVHTLLEGLLSTSPIPPPLRSPWFSVVTIHIRSVSHARSLLASDSLSAPTAELARLYDPSHDLFCAEQLWPPPAITTGFQWLEHGSCILRMKDNTTSSKHWFCIYSCSFQWISGKHPALIQITKICVFKGF